MTETEGSQKLASLGSSRELAVKLDCSHETARKLAGGLTRPTARMRTRMAERLGIDPESWNRPAEPPARSADPDLSPPAGTVMADVAVAPGSALAELRAQRDRLKAMVSDDTLTDTARLGAERQLTGCLRALAQVESQFDLQINAHIRESIDPIMAAIEGLPMPYRETVARTALEAIERLDLAEAAA